MCIKRGCTVGVIILYVLGGGVVFDEAQWRDGLSNG